MRKTVLEKYGRLIMTANDDCGELEVYELSGSFYAVSGDSYVEVANPACKGGLLHFVGEWEEFEEYEKPANLDELFEQMKCNDPDLPPWDMLPVFGGPDIEDPDGIWSWDETRMIVGTDSTNLRIVDRDDI
jgi:hypothetical protein